jgi:hypothetical protein
MIEHALQVTVGQLGTFDLSCPLCGPTKRKPASRLKPVLRVWRLDPGFATYHCARCGESGYLRDSLAITPNAAALARARAQAAERELISATERLSKARWLWSKRRALTGSIAETYLREARGYRGALPATLGYLPPRGEHGPAMIAAFALPTEPQPNEIRITDDTVRGVHLTRLAPDGNGKAGLGADKIMIGLSSGFPIVLASPNDLLGIVITEGVEDALSLHQTTGLGAWAAGCASRLPGLADAIPSHIECVTVTVDDDDEGRHHAAELAARLGERSLHIEFLELIG